MWSCKPGRLVWDLKLVLKYTSYIGLELLQNYIVCVMFVYNSAEKYVLLVGLKLVLKYTS